MTSVNSSMLTGLMSTMSNSSVYAQTEAVKLTETLVADVEIPQVDPQIVRRDVRLLIGIDRYRIDMVCVSIGIYFSRDGSGDRVMDLHPG
jgi:hypothetical protein